MHKIALTSRSPLSGKTTLARFLESEYGFVYAGHSLALLHDFVANWNNPISDPSEMISVEQVYREKEQWRPQLQTYGYQVGYNDPGKSPHWINRTLADWRLGGGNTNRGF